MCGKLQIRGGLGHIERVCLLFNNEKNSIAIDYIILIIVFLKGWGIDTFHFF